MHYRSRFKSDSYMKSNAIKDIFFLVKSNKQEDLVLYNIMIKIYRCQYVVNFISLKYFIKNYVCLYSSKRQLKECKIGMTRFKD